MPCRTLAPGAAGSVFDIVDNPRLNHRVTVVPGVLHDEAAAQLHRFFARLRREPAAALSASG